MSNLKKSLSTGIVSGVIFGTAFALFAKILGDELGIIQDVYIGFGITFLMKVGTLMLSNRYLKNHCNYTHKLVSNLLGSLIAILTFIIVISVFFVDRFPDYSTFIEIVVVGWGVQIPLDAIIPLFYKKKSDTKITEEKILDDIDFQDR